MAARPQRLTGRTRGTAIALLTCAIALAWHADANTGSAHVATENSRATTEAKEEPVAPAKRIASLVPALTEMLFAMGAGRQVVAVSSFDTYPPEVRSLPRVGALLNPDAERIFALKPDLVITYGSQTDLQARLARARIHTYGYRNGNLATLKQTLRDLGGLTGHDQEAERVIGDLQAQFDLVRAKVKGLVRPRTLMVFERDPLALRQLYVSGGTGFMHELLEIAGGINVFADVNREAVQPSTETLLVRAPQVIIEIRTANAPAPELQRRERAVWSPLVSIPAVRNDRVHFVYGSYLVLPGPRLGLAAEAFARAIHPEAFQ